MREDKLSIHYLHNYPEQYSEDYMRSVINHLVDNETSGKAISKIDDKTHSIDDYQFINNPKIVSIDLNCVSRLGIGAFECCENLGIVTGLKQLEISPYSFSQCYNLQTFKPKLSTVPCNCFYECHSLAEIILTDKVTSIDNDAFHNCYELTSVVGLNAKYIGINAFSNCYNLRKIDLGESLEIIDAYAFDKCNLVSISIPSSVEYIETEAFSNNVGLCQVIFNTPENAQIFFNQDVFKNCYNVHIINTNNNPYVEEFANSLK